MNEHLVLDRSFMRDPHHILNRLHRESPVSSALMWGDVPVWLITRYDDARILRAHRITPGYASWWPRRSPREASNG
jgi:hypothetical protein